MVAFMAASDRVAIRAGHRHRTVARGERVLSGPALPFEEPLAADPLLEFRTVNQRQIG